MDKFQRGSNNYRNGKRGPRRGFYNRGPSRGRYKCYPQEPYERGSSQYFPYHYNRKVASRPPSPIEGSEEYMNRKIEHTSAIIMRQLLSPSEIICSTKTICEDKPSGKETGVAKENTNQNKVNDKVISKTRRPSIGNLNAKDIHEKIMNHITNLNEGRKKNFINAKNSTGLDNAINHMQIQKRLEISRILRDMSCSSNVEETGDGINSIVPDIGIKIEELPPDVIDELRQTLNLDLEFLNEAIVESTDSKSSDNVTTSMESEHIESQGHQDIDDVEIKLEDISDIFEEPVRELSHPQYINRSESQCNYLPPPQTREYFYKKECVNSTTVPRNELESEVSIDELETNEELIYDSSIKDESGFTNSTVPYIKATSIGNQTMCIGEFNHVSNEILRSSSPSLSHQNMCKGDSTILRNEILSSRSSNNIDTFSFLEYTIKKVTQEDRQSVCMELDTILDKINLVESCVKHLNEYRMLLTKSIVRISRESSVQKSAERVSSYNCSKCSDEVCFMPKSCQTDLMLDRNDRHGMNKRKGEEGVHQCEEALLKSVKLKHEEVNEYPETNTILKFPNLQERIVAIERVDEEVVVATEAGNVIIIGLQDGSIKQTLDITQSIISSLVFVRGMNEFIYMYVGGLEEVLRVYDFRKRAMLKASRIDDQIRCMDSMWNYVFMGCKNGTLIRYSCKKQRIEFEEKNTGSDILVLKAAQEGPRRVLLVGHRQAPIYIRDAMSGLYLRNFSNQAVTPTVYSLLMNNNNLYCGTAKDNILVFSFHEGYLIKKIVADHSKGISCMKIFRNLLFAGCYNGSIYIYNLDMENMVSVLDGPGGSIMCMGVLSNQIIVSTITGKFESVVLPSELFS